MSRRAYLYFILTFVLGLIVGSAATIFYGWRSGVLHPRRPDEKHIVQFLTRNLNLDDSQAQQVGQIVHETGERIRELQHQADPQIDAARAEGRDRIRKVLRPDQLAKFNQLAERIDARRKGRRGP
jgi:hypothetical protein